MQQVLSSVSDKRVHMFVIWLPAIWSDDRDDALERSNEFPNDRVSYYWDGNKLTGKSWDKVLGLGFVAWDVYFLYNSDQHWQADVPAPAFWMHQLRGVEKGPYLDRQQFEQKVKQSILLLPKDH